MTNATNIPVRMAVHGSTSLAVLLTLMLLSCESSGPHEGTSGQEDTAVVRARSSVEDAATRKEREAIAEELIGEWMPDAFCRCVEEKRSVFACQKVPHTFFQVRVVRAANSRDSLVMSGYTEHEGGPEGSLGFDPATRTFEGTVDGVTVRPADSGFMDLRSRWADGWERYRKVHSTEGPANVLFEDGFTDEEGHGVEFDPKGRVSGLPGKDTFAVLYDFTEGHQSEDIIFIHAESDTSVWDHHAYHWRFAGDTLLLYKMEFIEPYRFRIGPLWKRLIANDLD